MADLPTADEAFGAEPAATAVPSAEEAFADTGMPESTGQAPEAAAALNGALLGFGPEVSAAQLLAIPGMTYEDAQKAAKEGRSQLEAFHKQHPVEAGLLEAGGSTLTTAPLLGAGSAIEQAALKGVPAVARLASGTLGSGLARLPSLGIAGAKTGAEAAALTSGLSDRPFLEQLETGAAFGGGMNLLAPGLRYLATPIGKNVNQFLRSAADKASDLGVDLRMSQLAPGLPKWFRGGTSEEQLSGMGKAIMKGIGADGEAVTPEAVETARSALSDKFKDIEQHVNISPSDTAYKDALATVETKAQAKWPHGGPEFDKVKGSIDEMWQDLADAELRSRPGTTPGNLAPGKYLPGTGTNTPTIEGGVPGTRYFAMTERGGPLDQLISNGPTREFGTDLRDAIDSAVDRGSNPDVLPSLQQVRRQYRDSLVAEKLASDSGAVDPTRIKAAINSVYGKRGAPNSQFAPLGTVGQMMTKTTAQGAGGHTPMPWYLKLFALGELPFDYEMMRTNPKAAAIVAGTTAAALGSKKAFTNYLNSDLYRRWLENPMIPAPNALIAGGSAAANQIQQP